MCSGIELDGEMFLWSDPDVRLPVLLKDGDLTWLRWGERHGARDSAFHEGPCARLESIRARKWDAYSPRPVRIPVDRYMERDPKGRPYWVKVAPGQTLQGLVASHDGEQRIYVVTIPAPPDFLHVQPRWPRVLGDVATRA